jgi:hypothetical protein
MSSAITLYEYLAYNVPSECQDILDRYDIPTAQNEDELTENLKAYVRVYRDEALEELAQIHPDKDLIDKMAMASTPYNGKSESEYLNASGTISRIESIEGQLRGGVKEDSLTKSDMLLGIGVAVLTLSLFKH